jgi:Co/Zn/Cd efflux system component
VLGLMVIYEAVARLITPPDVAGLAVTITAAAGVVVNLAARGSWRRPIVRA